MGSTTGEGTVQFHPCSIKDLGEQIVSTTGPHLDRALDKLQQAREIEYSNYSTVTPTLAIAYTIAVEFIEEEIKAKREHLDTIRDRLNKTARSWEDTENACTVQIRD